MNPNDLMEIFGIDLKNLESLGNNMKLYKKGLTTSKASMSSM